MPQATQAGFQPIAIAEVELTQPLPVIAAWQDGVRHGGARIVVRLHTCTLGVVDVRLAAGDLSSADCAQAVWRALSSDINAHLRADGLPEVPGLGAEGLPAVEAPRCAVRRAAVLREPVPVTVIIKTRNRAELLGRALASLQRLEYPAYDVLVIDGSADDATATVIHERFPAVRHVNVHPHGSSAALNRGLAEAHGEILAFTDDDACVDRHWLAWLVSGFDDPRVAVVTGIAFPMELRTPAQVWFEESGGFTDGVAARKIGLDLREPGSLLPFATGKIGAGVNMAWRRRALEEIGGFDVTLDTLTPLWPPRARPRSATQDLAAFFDVLALGHRIAFEPNAIVYHEHRRSYEALKHQIYWHGLGLSAYLVRSLLRRPGDVPAFLARVPRGLGYGFGASSIRNGQKSSTFPRELTRAEWRGVLEGPFAYLRGLPRGRRLRRSLRADGG
jgi:hypothetical protein